MQRSARTGTGTRGAAAAWATPRSPVRLPRRPRRAALSRPAAPGTREDHHRPRGTEKSHPVAARGATRRAIASLGGRRRRAPQPSPTTSSRPSRGPSRHARTEGQSGAADDLGTRSGAAAAEGGARARTPPGHPNTTSPRRWAPTARSAGRTAAGRRRETRNQRAGSWGWCPRRSDFWSEPTPLVGAAPLRPPRWRPEPGARSRRRESAPGPHHREDETRGRRGPSAVRQGAIAVDATVANVLGRETR